MNDKEKKLLQEIYINYPEIIGLESKQIIKLIKKELNLEILDLSIPYKVINLFFLYKGIKDLKVHKSSQVQK